LQTPSLHAKNTQQSRLLSQLWCSFPQHTPKGVSESEKSHAFSQQSLSSLQVSVDSVGMQQLEPWHASSGPQPFVVWHDPPSVVFA
jgi:hypothetical protein